MPRLSNSSGLEYPDYFLVEGQRHNTQEDDGDDNKRYTSGKPILSPRALKLDKLAQDKGRGTQFSGRAVGGRTPKTRGVAPAAKKPPRHTVTPRGSDNTPGRRQLPRAS